jgi:hypothetical protein
MPNALRTVPFLGVTDMSRSLAYYVDGLGFTIQHKWTPDGQIRWVWLTREGASIMLQEYRAEHRPAEKLGVGVSIFFVCEDALAIYHELRRRNIDAAEPQVGNGMWEFGLSDPDGYRVHFESPTDVPEDTKLSELPA